jgi:lysophospholipid acyltransferase (LPLAT)-like uncharacterized protein
MTYKVKLPENFEMPKTNFILAYWHRKLFSTIPIYKKMGGVYRDTYPIVSGHKDGDIATSITRKFGFGDVRGSSTRGGFNALKSSIRLLKDGKVVTITPDGPKGPMYSIQDGFVGMSYISKIPVLNLRYKVSRYWELKTWDKMIIPKPFSTIFVDMELIETDGLSKEELDKKIKEAMKKDV